MKNWLLLTYKLPGRPSAPRVYIWRKLKKLGATTIFEAVWVLPDSPRNYEQFQWLAVEIQEMGGEAMFWKAQCELPEPEEALIKKFNSQVDEIYQKILDKLDENDPDLVSLSQEYLQVKTHDYYHSDLGQQIRQRMLENRGDEP